MEKLLELKGTNGTIIAYDDRVIIKRKGFTAYATQRGFTGDRTFFYQDLNAVEYKKPSMVANGYMKFVLAGTFDTKATTGLYGGTKQRSSMGDQNTVILRAFRKEVPKLSEELYNLIIDNMSKAKNTTTTVVQSASNLDELKKLAELRDSGIISQEEFENQKLKLLV